MNIKNLIMGASNIEDIGYVRNWIVSTKQFKETCDIVLLVQQEDVIFKDCNYLNVYGMV